MSNIFQHNFNNCKLRLSNSDYWDHFISYDCEGSDLNHSAILSGDCLLIDIDFNNGLTYCQKPYNDVYSEQYGYGYDINKIYSLTSWTGATVYGSGVTLNDIGLTGIDNGLINVPCPLEISGSTPPYSIQYSPQYGLNNGFLDVFTGSTLFLPSGDTRFSMNSVSGCNYDYTINLLSGETEGSYVNLCGGFYQGFFKLSDKTFFKPLNENKFTWEISDFCLEDPMSGNTLSATPYNYQILPTRYEKGWTSEFWLRRGNDSCSGNTATTLNDIYSANTGFFYYMGTRSENKFWDVFSGESGFTTSSGIPLDPPAVTATTLSGNPFMVYNGSNLTSGCTFPGVETTVTIGRDRNADIVQNALGFRIQNDGSIGYRYLTVSGDCSGDTYVTGTSIEESYSDSGVVTEDSWTQVVVRFTAYNTLEGCELSNAGRRKGKLDFYINGFLKHSVIDFDEFLFRDLNEHREKQQGVPFNYSFGGGTQGLIETQTVNGPDKKDESLLIENYFAGTFEGCASIFRLYGCSLDVTTIRKRFDDLKNRFGIDIPTDIISSSGIYYGKVNTETITVNDVQNLLLFKKLDVAVNSYVTLPNGLGWGYLLIPSSFQQPSDLRNSDEGCDNYNIPYVTLGTIIVNDVNGLPITYNIYKTINRTSSMVDVWMCE